MPHKYKPYPRYKDSGVEWLGDVPRGWSAIPVGRVYNRTKRTGYQDKELLSVYRDHGVVPKSSRDDNNNKPSDDLSPYQLVKQNDLVLNKMKTWQGSIAVSKYEGIVSPAYYVYAPTKKLFDVAHSEYVHFLMRTPMYIAQYLRYSKGIRVNQWDLEPEQFKLIELVLPSKDEQRSIASFLDHETGKIDDLIEKQQKLIKLLEEKRQAVISHAVTKGLNPNAPMKDSGIDWLGDIPEHWELWKLAHAYNEIGSGTTPPSSEMKWYGKGVNWVTTGELRETVITKTKKELRLETLRAYPTLRIYPKGSIAMAMYGATIGRLGIFGIEATTNQACCVLTFSKQLDNMYVFYWLQGYKNEIIQLSDGGGQPNINQEKVASLRISAPSIIEQQSIINYLDKQTTKIDKLISKAKSAIDLMQERRTALISAAVTGKIDVREAV